MNYDKYDERAKNATLQFINYKYPDKLTYHSTGELYKTADMVFLTSTGTKFLVEVEVKNVWRQKIFPYPSIHVPYRKKDSKADLYIMFNSDITSLLATSMKNILLSKIVKKSTRNKYTNIQTTKEKFFEFDVSEAQFFYLSNNGWLKYEGSCNN